MSFFSQDADMNENKLGWSWLCSGQRQCWQLALNHSHCSSLKSSMHSEITSWIMQTFTDQVSRGDDEFALVWFFSVKSQTSRETGETLALKLALMTGWMSHEQHYTHHLFLGKACHCAIFGCFAIWQGRFELSIWACGFFQSKTAQCNRRLYFLKEILNKMCFLKLRSDINV